MIKKLRTKIIIFGFFSATLVFAIGLATLFGISHARLNDERLALLNSEFDKEDWRLVEPSSISGMVLAEYDPVTLQRKWMLVGNGVKQSEEFLQDALDKVTLRHFDSGLLGVKIVYSRRVQGDVLRIAMYDRDFSSPQNNKYLIYTILALIAGSALFFLISYFMARIALKPVEVTWKRQRQFVADASHELKTPLSVIRANTELVASHGDQTVDSQMQWIDNTRFEVERMTALVNDLLFLAKNDEGLKEELDTVNLSECVESVVLSQEVLLYEKGKSFCYDITPDITVLGNSNQLCQLTTILLDNANKYSKGSGNIVLSLSLPQGLVVREAELRVSNDCEPLSAEQLEHLFDRFYTVDQSRDRSHNGNGLGLAIAQTICENHDGAISASYADGRITFVVTMPVNKIMGIIDQ